MLKVINNKSACSMGCAYCIVDHNSERNKQYKESPLFFMNSFVAINIMEEWHKEWIKTFDYSLLEGDYVGFQGANEPLKYKKELLFILEKAREHSFFVAISTKASVSKALANELSQYKDVLKIEVSYAKLSELERNDSKRLETIKNFINAGLDVLVVIQPFIVGLTDVRWNELMNELQEAGVKASCLNGFRYEDSMEVWAKDILPKKVLKMYQENKGIEYLPERGKWENKLEDSGIKHIKISGWLKGFKKIKNGKKENILKLIQIAGEGTYADKKDIVLRKWEERIK